MQSSKIEQKIDDIYGFVESCKMQKLSTTKVVVPKNELYDLLDDLRREMPEEIQRYKKVLKQRDAILADAEKKAAQILADAKEQYEAMLEENNITQEAYQHAEHTLQEANTEADTIVDEAHAQAEEIGAGAIYYTDELLEKAEKSIRSAYETFAKQARELEAVLQDHLDILADNRSELMTDTDPEAHAEKYEEAYEEEPQAQEEDE